MLFDILFLDRDGVINERKPNEYIKNVKEFRFKKDVISSIKNLNKYFKKIIIVTNQRGIGLGLMSIEDLDKLNRYLINSVEKGGGKIHDILFSTGIDNTDIYRKPNIGLANEFKKKNPEFDFKKSFMVGDSQSDIDFGNNLNMKTVFIKDKYSNEVINYDLQFNSLKLFYKHLKKEYELFT